MDAKRGQITIFIIIGIMFLIAFWFLFYASDKLKEDHPGSGYSELSLSETTSIKSYAQSCIEMTLSDSIAHVGITDYNLLENYFNAHLKNCTNGFQGFPGISIAEGNVSSDFISSSDGKQVLGSIQFPLVIHKGNSSYSVSDFQVSYDLDS